MQRQVVMVAVLAGLGAGASPALAEQVVEAQTVWRFDAMTYTIDQGEALVLHNRDTLSPGPHNVTASTAGPDGKPLFASETIPNGKDAPVTGATQLKTGSYPFMCTVHPFMQATLNVTDQGSAPGDGMTPAASDTTGPRLRVALGPATLRSRVFTATLTSDEGASLSGLLTARVAGRSFRVGSVPSSSAQAGRAVTLRIHASGAARRRLRAAHRAALTLTIRGRDAAGNVGTATAHRTLRRAKRRS